MPDQPAIFGDLDPAHVLSRLHGAQGFVFDMDGTMVLGDRRNHGLKALPGAVELIALLHERDVPAVLFTNGTTRSPAHSAETLRSLGFALADSDVLTPVSAAIDCFRQRGHQRIMVMGGDGLAGPLEHAGFETTPPAKDSGADAVLVGWYREVSFDDLEAACDAVWAGARFYSCSQSLFFATAEGRVLGTSRAISAAVHDLTGCEIEIVGKPSEHAITTAAHRLGVPTPELVVVGDDPELEIAMAHRGGSLAVLVATGLDHDGVTDLPPDRRPHLSLSGVDQLLSLLSKDTSAPASG
jgi:4-nitrophenyl phosphatase